MDRQTLEHLAKKVAAAREIERIIEGCKIEIADAKSASYILVVHPNEHPNWAISSGVDTFDRIEDPNIAQMEALVVNMIINWKTDEIALLEAELAEL